MVPLPWECTLLSSFERVLVSRCLLGEAVRYDGACSGRHPQLLEWQARGWVVPLCPEMAGGLPTPRPAAEIIGGQGAAVLDGQQQVLTQSGVDVSAAFQQGAEAALALVARYAIKVAVLKANSPSCGNQQTYDGSFTGTRVPGEGVTAAALRRAGVLVFNETQLAAAEAALQQLAG